MSEIKIRTHMVDILFAIALFSVFAVSALLVSIIGARVYRNTVENMNLNFDTRSSVTYVSTKIRQGDEAGAVGITDLNGIPALLLEQNIDDVVYQTWIYHHAGTLKEIFTEKGTEIEPDFGTVIMEVDSLTVSKVGDRLFRISSTDMNGVPAEVFVSTRT